MSCGMRLAEATNADFGAEAVGDNKFACCASIPAGQLGNAS